MDNSALYRYYSCDYCHTLIAPYRIVDEGQVIYLCKDCRDDAEYCMRKGYEAPKP